MPSTRLRARRAEKEGFTSYMVTPDKDFGQLVDENTFLYKPSRGGDGVEIMGLPEIKARWGIQRPEQVVEVLALMGDTSDNVPGVPGIGKKNGDQTHRPVRQRGEFARPHGRIEGASQGDAGNEPRPGAAFQTTRNHPV